MRLVLSRCTASTLRSYCVPSHLPVLSTLRTYTHFSDNDEGASAASPSPPPNQTFKEPSRRSHQATYVPTEQATKEDTTHNAAPLVPADDNAEWIKHYVNQAVSCGKQTPESAAYFEEMLHAQPDLLQCIGEARRMMGGQEPASFTKYQQGLFSDRMSKYISSLVSERMLRAQAEDAGTKRYTSDGSATGENYWFEAGSTLSASDVPGYVKDEVLADMQRERKPTSPAFERPLEEEKLASSEPAYGEMLRKRKQHLFTGTDFKG